MRAAAVLGMFATACVARGTVAVTTTATGVATNRSICRTAYADYEERWRIARTEELQEFAAGDPGVLEEILYYELATLPSRDELTKLRNIYAVVDAFLWNTPWPRALAATEIAIEQCGELTPRPGPMVAG